MRRTSSSISLILIAGTLVAFPQERVENVSTEQELLIPVGNLNSSPLPVDSAFQHAMLASGVPGGQAKTEGCARLPEVEVRFSGTTLREALDSIVVSDPRYGWEVKDGVVDLLPVAAVPALLGIRISAFDSKDAKDIASAGTFLFALPEIRDGAAKLGLAKNGSGTGLYAIVPGSPPPHKPLDVHLRGVTVLDALNAIVRANRRGVWVYRETGCPTPSLFDISFAQ
jgi:hypothetical protein